jgi:hypothetical protein
MLQIQEEVGGNLDTRNNMCEENSVNDEGHFKGRF